MYGFSIIANTAAVFSLTVAIITAVLIVSPFITTDRVTAEVIFDITGCLLLLYTAQFWLSHSSERDAHYCKSEIKIHPVKIVPGRGQ